MKKKPTTRKRKRNTENNVVVSIINFVWIFYHSHKYIFVTSIRDYFMIFNAKTVKMLEIVFSRGVNLYTFSLVIRA